MRACGQVAELRAKLAETEAARASAPGREDDHRRARQTAPNMNSDHGRRAGGASGVEEGAGVPVGAACVRVQSNADCACSCVADGGAGRLSRGLGGAAADRSGGVEGSASARPGFKSAAAHVEGGGPRGKEELVRAVLQHAVMRERLSREASERREQVTRFYQAQRDANTHALLTQLLAPDMDNHSGWPAAASEGIGGRSACGKDPQLWQGLGAAAQGAPTAMDRSAPKIWLGLGDTTAHRWGLGGGGPPLHGAGSGGEHGLLGAHGARATAGLLPTAKRHSRDSRQRPGARLDPVWQQGGASASVTVRDDASELLLVILTA